MGISRLTAINIMTNETSMVDVGGTTELWLMRNGAPHSLLLSCPKEHRSRLEEVVEEIKGHDSIASLIGEPHVPNPPEPSREPDGEVSE